MALAAIGRDRPGIVAGITEVLLQHGLNIEDSQMRILGGHFAMMLLVNGEPDEVAALRALRRTGEELGLDYLHLLPVSDAAATRPPTHILTVYGADHPGIVNAFTTVLAEQDANITDLQTRLAGEVYVMVLEVVVRGEPAELDAELQRIAAEQGVDMSLRELERDAL